MKTGSRNKAKVAIANKLARAIFHIIADPIQKYKEKGYQKVITNDDKVQNHIRALKKLGVTVNYKVVEKIVDAENNIEVKAA